MTTTVHTDRLTLRPFAAADGPALFGYLSQPAAVEFEPYDVCSLEEAMSWALLERLGLRREAHLLSAASFSVDEDGQRVWHDTYQYAQLARSGARPAPLAEPRTAR